MIASDYLQWARDQFSTIGNESGLISSIRTLLLALLKGDILKFQGKYHQKVLAADVPV